MKKATIAVMAISLAVLLVSAGALYSRAADDRTSAAAFQALSQRRSEGMAAFAEAAPAERPTPEMETAAAQPGATGAPVSTVPTPRPLPETTDPALLSYRAMAGENGDLVGWLTIEGTVIDYPVMRTPDDPEKYLHLSYEGAYSRAGTPFMLPVSDPAVPNQNIIIYAHHMKDGSMFGQLPLYERREAYEAQPLIRFDSLYERGLYRIIAVFRTSIGAEREFPYYEYEWLEDEETFDRYMRGVTANQLYDTGETAAYGDQLLSLSTCDYHEPNGRLVVVAKRVMEGEERTDA